MIARNGAGGSPPLHLANVVAVDLSELGGDHGSGHPVVGGQAVEGFVVVFTGDPYGLAIGEAGSRGEAHWLVAVESIVAGRGGCPSHPVQEVCQCLLVVCLRLKGPSADGAGVGCLRSGGGTLADLPLSQSALADQVSNVGVGSHGRFVWYALS